MSTPSRAAESRDAQRRPFIEGATLELDVNLKGLPSGMEAIWVRESSFGQVDQRNISRKLEAGFVPVTTEHLPHLVPPVLDPDEAPTTASKLIRRGGQVLMMRPKLEADAERRFHQQSTEEAKRDALHLTGNGQRGQDVAEPVMDGENFIEARPEVREVVTRTNDRGESTASRKPGLRE